jgi:SAM-dependent methyltransferase
MDLKQLLNATSVLLVDDTYAGLRDTTFSKYLLREMLDSPIDGIVSFICDGQIRGIAFKQDFWTLVTDIVRFDSEFDRYARALHQGVKSDNKRSFVMEAADFHAAVCALLCDLLVSGESCECYGGRRAQVIAYSPERQERLQLFLKTKIELSYDLNAGEMLEVCCGNGMATAALRELGYNVYAIDNDKCAVCEGLFYGALAKENTLVMDARYLVEYELAKYHEFRYVAGFMLGAIYEFNKPDWQKILSETAEVISEGLLLFTAQKKEEVDFIYKTMLDFGIEGEIIDNRDDTSIYDQWAYLGVKRASASSSPKE